MSVRHTRPARAALAALTAAGLAAGALAVAAPAQAATPGTSAAIYGTSDPTYDGVFRQSIAILGQHAAGVTVDPAAVQWLLDQQCTNGGFLSYDADTSTRCTAADGVDSNATAVAVQALLAVGEDAQAQSGATLLRDSQVAADGGWEYTLGSGWGTDPNSTGVVLSALAAAGVTPTHDPLPVFLDRQVGRDTAVECTPEDPLEDPYVWWEPYAPAQLGAIAYSQCGTFSGPNVLATVQSVPGLHGTDLVDVPSPVDWDAAAPDNGTEPAETAAGVARWATAWLADKVEANSVFGSNLAWAVLSFASDTTARDAAEDAYASLRSQSLYFATDPGSLGLAALAATALGETEDAELYAGLTARTLTEPVLTPLPPKPEVKDTTAPKVKVTKPKQAKKVASWKTLRGTSSDAGSGVATVTVRAVQKRSGDWFAYTGKKWKKQATQKKASAAAKAVVVKPAKSGAWKLRLAKLKQGTLKVRVQATDVAGNTSPVRTTSAKLTKK